MGFRSYIRQFLGAVLMLFRPSLPWGFWAWFDFWRRSLLFRRVAGAAAAAMVSGFATGSGSSFLGGSSQPATRRKKE